MSQYPAEYFQSEAFAQRMHLWCSLNSIRNFPDEIAVNILEDMLRKDMGNLTFQEMELAMKMNMAGDFTEEVNSFNSLDARFLMGLAKQYRKYRLLVEKQYEKAQLALKKQESALLTPTQKDFIQMYGAVVAFRAYKQGHEIFGHASLYDIFKKYGMAVFSKEREDKETETCISEAQALIAATLDREVREMLTEINSDEKRRVSGAFLNAKKKLLIEFFDNAIKNGDKIGSLMRKKFMDSHDLSEEKMTKLQNSIPDSQIP